MLIILVILILNFLIVSCGNNKIYRSVVVQPEVKKTITQILNKEVTLKELNLQYLKYRDIKLFGYKKEHLNPDDYRIWQNIIDSLKNDEIDNIEYQFRLVKDKDIDFAYKVTITYTKINIQKYFVLYFRKIDYNDDYYFINAEIQPEDESNDSLDTP
ncbi:MAG: hypothetical protein NTW25_11305 [Candidatus Kapabacteria bacterium]|nr:hypothetical protein [Candidatus Kapabacteria bacterium]